MSRTLTASLIIAGLWLAYAAASLWPGALSITKHSGDALHMIAISERLAQGQLPHIDFMTPIGGLAFWPVAGFVALGFSAGQAFIIAQLFVGALLSAAALFVGLRRMPWIFATGLAALVLVLSVAFVHGEAEIAVSVSMHYNRWAWALAFVALAMAVLPVERGGSADGLLLGCVMAALVLIKVTYFAALAPIIILAMLLTGQRMALAVAVITGLTIAVVLTGLWGLGFWAAYLSDLLTVAGSEVRPKPGLDFGQILWSPAYLVGTAAAFAMGVTLRRSGFEAEGLTLLLMIGAGGYITYQNFGNDPQWLALFALLLGVWAAEAPRTGGRPVLTIGAVLLAAAIAPSFVNMAASPFRHLGIDPDDYMPALAGSDYHQDLRVSRIKANRLRGDVALLEGYRKFNAPEPTEPATFRGEVLPDCRTEPMPGYFASIAADLADRGLAQGARVFNIDILNPYWLYGAHPPLKGGTPWYYDGLPGLADAEFVILPSCPILTTVRNLIAAQLEDVPMTEVARTPLYTLYALEGGEG